MEPIPMVFIIDSQHITDPRDENRESMCGLPVQGELSETLDLGEPSCENCLRLLADRIADARAASPA
jgi:hypothetical protein